VGSPRRTGPALKKYARRPIQPVSGPAFRITFSWSWRRDLNPRPSDYKSDALPAELRQPYPPGNQFGRPKINPIECADTLPLRTFNGIEIKVSTPRRAEQTGPEDGRKSAPNALRPSSQFLEISPQIRVSLRLGRSPRPWPSAIASKLNKRSPQDFIPNFTPLASNSYAI
jgi:hypothetical protein